MPNKITVSRFILTVLFLLALLIPGRLNHTAALVAFLIAGATDLVDGRLARSRGQISSFGVLMDPLADKVLVCSAFIALIEKHIYALAQGSLPMAFKLGSWCIYPRVYAWMAVIVVARELTVTGLRLLAAAKGVILPAEKLGKHKTTLQMLAIVALLALSAMNEWHGAVRDYLLPWLPAFALVVLWAAVGLTAVSGAVYLWRNRQLYMRES